MNSSHLSSLLRIAAVASAAWAASCDHVEPLSEQVPGEGADAFLGTDEDAPKTAPDSQVALPGEGALSPKSGGCGCEVCYGDLLRDHPIVGHRIRSSACAPPCSGACEKSGDRRCLDWPEDGEPVCTRDGRASTLSFEMPLMPEDDDPELGLCPALSLELGGEQIPDMSLCSATVRSFEGRRFINIGFQQWKADRTVWALRVYVDEDAFGPGALSLSRAPADPDVHVVLYRLKRKNGAVIRKDLEAVGRAGELGLDRIAEPCKEEPCAVIRGHLDVDLFGVDALIEE